MLINTGRTQTIAEASCAGKKLISFQVLADYAGNELYFRAIMPVQTIKANSGSIIINSFCLSFCESGFKNSQRRFNFFVNLSAVDSVHTGTYDRFH